MPGEFDLYGVFIPTLLCLMVVGYAIKALLRFGLARIGFYRWVWHPALFNFALYIFVVGGLFSLLRRMTS